MALKKTPVREQLAATGEGGVQIKKFSLSRLTPPLDNVLPMTTGGGGSCSQKTSKNPSFQLKNPQTQVVLEKLQIS